MNRIVAEFRSIAIGIPDISQGEKLDRFIEGLKRDTKLEVLKANVGSFEQAVHVALNMDRALFGSKISGSKNFRQHGLSGNFGGSSQNYHGFEEDKLETKNVERREEVNQRQKDRINKSCFTSHKKGCRPWLHKGGNHQQSFWGGQQRPKANN